MPTIEGRISRRGFLTILPALTVAIPTISQGERLSNKSIEQIEGEWLKGLEKGTIKAEIGCAFDKNGNEILEVKGNKYGISLTEKERHQIMGQTWTHLHIPTVDGQQTIPLVDFYDGRFGYYNSLRQVRTIGYDPITKRKFRSWASMGNRVWWPDVPVKNMEWQVDEELKTINEGGALDRNIEAYKRVWQRWADGNHAEFHLEIWK